MASTQPQRKTIRLKGSKLYFSRRAVRLGNAVYLVRNITGFRVTEADSITTIRNKNLVPFEFIIFMCLVGLFLLSRDSSLTWVIGIIILIILSLIYNAVRPKTYEILTIEYVIEVSFVSGDKANILLLNHKKVASDDKFLEDVVSKLYKVLDSNDERTYVVNIEDKSITIDQSRSSFGVGYSEITTAQQIGVTIENRQQ
ncbi:hypothetical protein K4039_13355 [Lyngbya sp. CCAP 1446/10]|uniref:hypothetical protein n=1 Tax=Lyngbya sp. CCAP 1446/10 TaxID=439293 RepID=UPI002238D6AF|nr:hypothetical protein [Lyngbya sp. CCAP 1446/10]MCW6051051.1 hypothetical protein [Lyngbya sp. CCAP 1446/10]